MKSLRRILVPALASVALVATAASASANSASASTTYPDGARLTGNMWISTFSDWSGCGNFASSTTITKTPDWIKDTASFHANGWGASISGGSVSGSGADAAATVINNRGQLGAYLSGSICVNWLPWYVSATTTGSALHYGNIKVVSAGV